MNNIAVNQSIGMFDDVSICTGFFSPRRQIASNDEERKREERKKDIANYEDSTTKVNMHAIRRKRLYTGMVILFIRAARNFLEILLLTEKILFFFWFLTMHYFNSTIDDCSSNRKRQKREVERERETTIL